ncbi:MAG: hypothetical protein ACYSYT_02040 [Planctomycetota bacterium]|jgi:hypothetical protein
MVFRYYADVISRASRRVAYWIFIVGLMLIGFGVLIISLPELFALLAAGVFFIAGAGCAITAVKIYLAQRRLGKMSSHDSAGYRTNVEIHREEHFDL